MGNKFVSAAGDNPLLKVVLPADRRGARMKAPSERAPRGKYAGGVLENEKREIFCDRSKKQSLRPCKSIFGGPEDCFFHPHFLLKC